MPIKIEFGAVCIDTINHEVLRYDTNGKFLQDDGWKSQVTGNGCVCSMGYKPKTYTEWKLLNGDRNVDKGI